MLEKSLGPAHPDPRLEMADLVYFYFKQKQYRRALPLSEPLVSGLKKSEADARQVASAQP